MGLSGVPCINVVTGIPTTSKTLALVSIYTPSEFVRKNGGGVEDGFCVKDND